MNERKIDVVKRMANGYRCVVGRGIYNANCILVNDETGDRITLARNVFVRMKNEGLIKYGDGNGTAVLTDNGMRLARGV